MLHYRLKDSIMKMKNQTPVVPTSEASNKLEAPVTATRVNKPASPKPPKVS